jgi:hypothetical protein
MTLVAVGWGLAAWMAMPVVFAGDPCCAITNIAEDGQVSVRETATGRTLAFQVNQPALLSSLRIGQEVWANFKTQQVSVDGIEPCCQIIPVSARAGATPAGVRGPAAMFEPMGADVCCAVVANPALKGQMGRLVVNFPGEAKARGRKQWVVYQAGSTTELLSRYEDFTGELLPGTYDLVVSGQRVNGVRIKAGHDTKLRLGTLRVQAAQDTPVAILDQEGKVGVTDYGNFEVGLPIGTFQVEVRGQRASVTIREGQVTRF